ncbi:RNA polymerase sigma factor [Lysinibacillus pakistanensis]|uniref:RNA polymerase sigma factor n=1 Tax=Lysinibacillus pakistanensis TaxID=759811 RepID=A0AAX3WTB9_9BACI|nr:RNA polymerase sigma factor [Lysinibacillus pakistanensis]MDM5230314.1 RNA polymerase sigma factor [Lysinibacillus pakistanensis]QGG53080.1 sigma-70 family RNA polymerase sigma factor [Lysinibacillus pakistanensis]WHY45898.1 RNA polymerase sigma factor [Lysinibacillus pakistanensis]WHY50910.1 RNA polymerase sigma factor [Lysinibacillus pakistanensis]
MFEEQFYLHNQTIFKYLYYLLNDEKLAEDFTQETFMRFFKYRQTIKEGAELAWLRSTARNLAYDYYRRKRLIQFVPFLNDHEELEPNLPHQWLIQQEDAKKLYLAISKLKLTYRDVIILRKIEELSIQETCDVLGWNEGKVKNTLKRALVALKKQLGGEFNEEL